MQIFVLLGDLQRDTTTIAGDAEHDRRTFAARSVHRGQLLHERPTTIANWRSIGIK